MDADAMFADPPPGILSADAPVRETFPRMWR